MNAAAQTPRPPGRIAGIDYGSVRVGIAICDPQQTIASPLESYTRRGESLDAQRMRQLVEEYQIARFVVGLPVFLDGRESPKSREARRFGAWLQTTTGVPVVFFDERFTTVQAEQWLGQAELTSKRRKQRVDKLAAQILLSAYLESSRKSQDAPGPLDDSTHG